MIVKVLVLQETEAELYALLAGTNKRHRAQCLRNLASIGQSKATYGIPSQKAMPIEDAQAEPAVPKIPVSNGDIDDLDGWNEF